jgi:hypothetical protein
VRLVKSLELATKPVLPTKGAETLSGYRSLSASPWSHDERALLALSPVVGWQNARSDAAAHTNPEQQGGSSAAPHCCPCTEQLPPVSEKFSKLAAATLQGRALLRRAVILFHSRETDSRTGCAATPRRPSSNGLTAAVRRWRTASRTLSGRKAFRDLSTPYDEGRR